MIELTIDERFRRVSDGSSVGTQNKYFFENYWYKTNSNGYEHYAEYLVTLLLEHSTIKNYAKYEICKVNGKNACRSQSFTKGNENFVSLERLYSIYRGGSLQNKIYEFSDVQDRKKYVVDFIKDIADLDISTYVDIQLQLDCLTLNVDRHLHNIGLLQGPDCFREAPIFDNGASLFSNFTVFPPYLDMDECLENAVARPFSGSFTQQVDMKHPLFHVNYNALFKDLDKVEFSCRGIEVLKSRLLQFRSFDAMQGMSLF